MFQYLSPLCITFIITIDNSTYVRVLTYYTYVFSFILINVVNMLLSPGQFPNKFLDEKVPFAFELLLYYLNNRYLLYKFY